MLQKITLVSAYGRAHWLAKELCSLGYKVTLIDVTEKLGVRSPELWENPFGVFHTQRLSNSQQTWLSDSTMIEIKKGFSLLLPTGPAELLSPLKKHFFKKLNLETMAQNILKASTSKEDRDLLISQILEDEYATWWIYYFAYNCSGSRFQHNFKSFLNEGLPLPILENWSLRLTTRRSFDLDLENLEDWGVQVIKKESLLGHEKEGVKLKALKLDSDTFSIENCYCFLTQEEVCYLNKDLYKSFFGTEPVLPQWYWSKYRILIKPTWVSNSLPHAFVITDPYLPWTRQDLIVVHRGSMADEFNLWVRMPYGRRFDSTYIQKLGDRIKEKFVEKCPLTEVKDFDLPAEFGQSAITMGPPPFPVFDGSVAKTVTTTLENVEWCGPENWERLDWESVLNYQTQIFGRIRASTKSKETVRRRGRDLEIYS